MSNDEGSKPPAFTVVSDEQVKANWLAEAGVTWRIIGDRSTELAGRITVLRREVGDEARRDLKRLTERACRYVTALCFADI